jgi:two-component system chemotaxis response regulator CheY
MHAGGVKGETGRRLDSDEFDSSGDVASDGDLNSAPDESEEIIPLKAVRALIVDDVQLNCELLAHMLGKYFDCATANSGLRAIELFQEAWENDMPFDLICLDIMMPGLDGEKVLEILRMLEAKIDGIDNRKSRIIMVTACFDRATTVRCRGLGCDAYIVKPLDAHEF